jgi:hypothetical protein
LNIQHAFSLCYSQLFFYFCSSQQFRFLLLLLSMFIPLCFLFPCYFLFFFSNTFCIHATTNSRMSKMCTTFNNKHKLLSAITPFFSTLNISPITFIFLPTYHLLMNAWSSKLIRPITTSLCPLYSHMEALCIINMNENIEYFIFWLLHVRNHPTLVVLTPTHLPCTPSTKCTHLLAYCDNTFVDYNNFFVDYANKYDDCVNMHDD